MSGGIRVAFVGAGGMARTHIAPLLSMPDVHVVALSDPQPARCEERVREVADLRPGAAPRCFSDPVEMLSCVDADVAYIVLPPFAHGPAEKACIERRLPFFIEKPVGLDMGLTREIAAEVVAQGLPTCAGYMNRYRAGVQRARTMLQSDAAVLMHGGWVGGSPNPQPGDAGAGSWWVQKHLSGGQIVEQTTHTFDVVRYLAGDAVEVFAYAARGFNRNLYNYTIDDASVVNIRFASGGVCNLMSSCAANGGGGGVWLHVYSHDATFLFSGWEHSVRVLRAGHEPEEIKGEADIFAVEDAVFMDAIRTGDASDVLSTYPDAARTLELTLAANESIATGRPVSIGG